MNRLLALILILPSGSFAQETTDPASHLSNSRLSIDISAAAHFQDQYYTVRSFYPGPDVQVSYSLNTNWKLTGQSFFGVTNDPRNKWLQSGVTGNPARFLNYNQSSLTVVRRLATKESVNDRHYRNTTWNVRLGYFYTQQSWYSEPSYYQCGELTPDEPIYITGYRAHSAAVGIGYSSLRIRTRATIRQHFYADMLIGASQSVQSAYLDKKQMYHDHRVYENFKRHIYGVRIGYEYRRYWKRHVGFVTGIEAQLRPIVDYKPNTNGYYYALRGGEALDPIVFVVKAGISYRL